MDRRMADRRQRRFKRYDVDGIQGRLERVRELAVRNLSLTGLAVESTEPLKIGHSSTLEMTGGYDEIDVPVEVMWSRLVDVRYLSDGAMENVYHAGLDFSDALDEKAQEILRFIEGHVIIDVGRPLMGHFRNGSAATTLNAQRDFRVKRIWFSGMLVEIPVSCTPTPDSVLEIELAGETLPLECAARVARIRRVNGNDHCDISLDFQELSIDSGLALDYFIRQELE